MPYVIVGAALSHFVRPSVRQPPFNFALPITLLFAYYIIEIVDAARTTHRNARRPARPYDHWWVWAAVVALFLLVVQPAVTAVFRRAGQGFVFAAESMTQTVLRYDYVMVDKTSTTRRRGEVIAFERDVRGRRRVFIFRVIGLPGDRVAVRDGHAVINDVPTAEPYAMVHGTPTSAAPSAGSASASRCADRTRRGSLQIRSSRTDSFGKLARCHAAAVSRSLGAGALGFGEARPQSTIL